MRTWTHDDDVFLSLWNWTQSLRILTAEKFALIWQIERGLNIRDKAGKSASDAVSFGVVVKFAQTRYNKLNHHSLSLFLYFTVMVSIWEGNQCKKAQLTLMEISTAIKNKVVSRSRCGGFSFLSFPLKQKCLWASTGTEAMKLPNLSC